MTLPIGQMIRRRYRISREQGSHGAAGASYLAHDLQHGNQQVVIEEHRLHAELQPGVLAGWLAHWQNLDHAHIPRVYDAFMYKKRLCVVLQHIPGRTLLSYLTQPDIVGQSAPNDELVRRWMMHILEAAAFLHSGEMAHGSMTAANVLIQDATGDAFLYGAIPAPAGPSDDVYALGALFFWMLTGEQLPAPNDASNATMPWPGAAGWPALSEIERIVLKAIDEEPSRRYPDAVAMLAEMQALRTFSTTDVLRMPANAAGSAAAGLHDGPRAREEAIMLPLEKLIKERYYIVELISEHGGFGTTYRAMDHQQSREVIIKVSKTTEDLNQDALLEERDLLRGLSHPCLPKVYDAFFYEQHLCLAIEYIPGRDLSSYLNGGTPDLQTTLRWMGQLLEALIYLHNHDIVHCDVKPANVRVHSRSGDIFLLDFGISARHNRAVVRAYTPHFSAPEQREPGRPIIPASDVYAVGATFYNLLTGMPPSDSSKFAGHVRFPDKRPIAIPESLERVVLKALRFDPAERYPNAQAMFGELRRLRLIAPKRRFGGRALLFGGAVTALIAAGAFVALGGAIIGAPRAAPAAGSTPGSVARATVTPAATSPTALPTLSTPGGQAVHPTSPASSANTSPSPASLPTPAATPTGEPAAGALVEPNATVPLTGTETLTATPAYTIERLEVAEQSDSAAIVVSVLPLRMALFGENLGFVRTAIFKPVTPTQDQPAVGLNVLRVEPGRVDLELTSLPAGYQNGLHELLLNGQPVGLSFSLHDYIRESRIRGARLEYRYLAAIRPFPSYRLKDQEIPGPFAVLYLKPDESARGGYLRNGDLLEILDERSDPGWYRVRVKENFDPGLVGYEGWVLAWVVDDTPPAPPAPDAIQMSWNIRGEKVDTVIGWLMQRGIVRERIVVDLQTRDRIPETFDQAQPDQVLSSDPPEGAWVLPDSVVVLGVRAP